MNRLSEREATCHPRPGSRAFRWIAVLAVAVAAASGLAGCASASDPPTVPPGYLVGAYYYPWYYSGHWASHDYVGKHLPEPLEPQFGEYVSDDPKVIANHLDLAATHGIDFFILSWSLKDSFADLTLRKYVLPAMAQTSVKHAVYLEMVAYEGRNVDDPAFRARLLDDLRFLGTEFLSHPSALRVGDRPVLFFYASRVLTGDIPTWMREVRAMYASMGLNPFVVADEAFWYEPDVARVKAYDAITAYNVYDWPRTGDRGWAATSGFLPGAESLFTTWQAATKAAGTAFVPNAMPGYNDRGVRLAENHYVIPRRLSAEASITSLFERSVDLAKRFADPTLRMIAITTFNEWHEWTAIEPTRKAPERPRLPNPEAYTEGFPHDDFGTAYLDVVRDRLGDPAMPAPGR